MGYCNKKPSGFSLVELAVILAITGLFVATALQSYRTYVHNKAENVTALNRNTVAAALARYVYTHQSLPCPADPSLTPEDPNAGKQNCLDANVAMQNTIPYCSGAVCREYGYRDTSGNFVHNGFLIGAVPYVALGITLPDTLDGWGNKMTYAVTESMTKSGQYIPDKGVLNVEQYNSLFNDIEKLYSPDCTNVLGCWDLVVFSAGPDRKGAYNYEGKQTVSCTPSPYSGTGLPPNVDHGDAQGYDSENCDMDPTFVMPYSLYNPTKGATHYDDPFMIDQLTIQSDNWVLQGASHYMNNKSGGKVGVGTVSPQHMLDVAGNIRVKGNVYSDSYCNPSSGDCFNPKIFAGTTGITCNSGMMTGVKNSLPQCAYYMDPSMISTGTCPTAGTYLRGYNADGTPDCQPN